MAMPPLTNEQKLKASWGVASLSTTIAGKTKEARVIGRIGVLEHFGFTPDVAELDLYQKGVDRDVTRRATRRSRHLGDIVKTGVSGTSFKASFYPSRRGIALAGEPIVLENVTTQKRWTVQLDGPLEVLIAKLDSLPGTFNIKVWTKSGARMDGEIVRVPSGGGTLAQQQAPAGTGGGAAAAPVPQQLPVLIPPANP